MGRDGTADGVDGLGLGVTFTDLRVEGPQRGLAPPGAAHRATLADYRQRLLAELKRTRAVLIDHLPRTGK